MSSPPSMKIVISSDLHCDFSQPPINWPEGDILVIAGDTANTIGDELKLLHKVSELYQHVITVDGNHTHYANRSQKRTIEQTLVAIMDQLPPNVHLLGHHNPHVECGGIHFVGCNGWYSFDMTGDPVINRILWKQEINDCHKIGLDVISQIPIWDRAVNDAELMREAINQITDDKPIVAVTHTAPHRYMVKWAEDIFWNRLNSFYVNSHMQKVLENEGQRVSYWINGHTHHALELMVGQVSCISKPRGYPSENPSWKPRVVTIP